MKWAVAVLALIYLSVGCSEEEDAQNHALQLSTPLDASLVDAASTTTADPTERRLDEGIGDGSVTPASDAANDPMDAGAVDSQLADANPINDMQDSQVPDGTVPTACSDGLDNDGDDRVDYPIDPGCMSADDDDETTPATAACADGEDNDGDDRQDFPNDPGCSSVDDPSEASACGPDVEFIDITGQTQFSGTTSDGNAALNICRNNRAPEKAFLFTLRRPVSRLRIDTIGSSFDTLLAVWRRCDDPMSEVACNDDLNPGRRASEILLNNPALGDYFIFIDGHGRSSGQFTLNIRGELNFGDPCFGEADPDSAWLACGTGRLCRNGTCQSTACADGLDNDGDGQFDFPTEPGCIDRNDDDEADPAIRAECSDGLDNDGDNLIDYPIDPDCDSAADNEEARPPQCRNGRDDDGDNFTDLDDPGCAGDPEQDFEVNTPLCRNQRDDDQDNLIDYPNDPGCESIDDTDERDPEELPQCADEIDNDGDGLVDYPDDAESCLAAGDLTEDDPCERLNARDITGQSRTRGSSLESSNDFEPSCAVQTGRESVLRWRLPEDKPLDRFVITSKDSDIDTIVSVRTACAAANEIACNDDDPTAGFDDAGMSRVVLRNISGGTELLIFVDGAQGASGIWRLRMRAELAEGANCGGRGQYVCAEGLTCQTEGDREVCRRPDCDDGRDNDQDGKTDFPFDPGCESLDDQSEADPLIPPQCGNRLDDDQDGLIDYPADPGCNFAADRSEAADCADGIDNDGDGQFDFDSNNNGFFDGNDEIGCACLQDPSETDDPPCSDRCDNDGDGLIDLDDPGCLNNPNGLTEFNEIQCKDGVDNDGNGVTDYPNDPGCQFRNDPSEQSPNPVGECADGVDNDGDGFIDYPNGDPGCSSAGDDTERFTCETDVPVLDQTGSENGSTTNGQSETKGSCSVDFGAPEVLYQVSVPYAARVQANVSETDFDATIYVRSSCWPRSRCDGDLDQLSPDNHVNLGGLAAGGQSQAGEFAGGQPAGAGALGMPANGGQENGGMPAGSGELAPPQGGTVDAAGSANRPGGMSMGGTVGMEGGRPDDSAGLHAGALSAGMPNGGRSTAGSPQMAGIQADAGGGTTGGSTSSTAGIISGGQIGEAGQIAGSQSAGVSSGGQNGVAGAPLAGISDAGGTGMNGGALNGGTDVPTGGRPGAPCVPNINTELACDNNPVLFTSAVDFQWTGGPIFVFVDGFGYQAGQFRLNVTATYPEGGQCGPIESVHTRCIAGTTCRDNPLVGHPTCQR